MSGPEDGGEELRSERHFFLSPQTVHDMRTPLGHIIGYSELLLERCEEEGGDHEMTPELKKIRDAGYLLLSLMDEHFGSLRTRLPEGGRAEGAKGESGAAGGSRSGSEA